MIENNFSNLTNLSGLTNGLGLFDNPLNHTYICELNQYAMLEQTQKLPIVAFYISLIMLILLLFWFYVQWRFKKIDEFLGLETVRSATALNIFLCLILMYTALNLSESQFKIIENVLWTILIVLGIILSIIIYKRYKHLLKPIE